MPRPADSTVGMPGASSRLIATIVGIVAGAGWLGGCDSECRGPGCESAYPLGRVDWLTDLSLDDETVLVDDATGGALVGGRLAGSAFSMATVDGTIFVGQPETGRVVATPFADREIPDQDAPLAWTGNGRFGAAVAATGDALFAGAPAADDERGEVHRVPLDAPAADVVITGLNEGDRFGEGLALCPDQTGDGAPELLVWSPWLDAGPAGEAVPRIGGGVTWIPSEAIAAPGTYRGAEVGVTWWGATLGEAAGTDLSCEVDVDGDGVVDLLVGAPHAEEQRGRIYLISGATPPPSGPLLEAAAWAISGNPSDNLGSSMVAYLRGETPFALLGAPGRAGGNGRVYLLELGAQVSGTLTPFGILDLAAGETGGQHFGREVDVADLDGDGSLELVVGAPDLQVGQSYDVGRILVFSGEGVWQGPHDSGEASLILTDDQSFRQVGARTLADDLDGDGRAELLLSTRAR